MFSKLKKIDISIVLILLAFMVVSTLLVHSATYGNPDYANYDLKTVIFFGLGFFVAIMVTIIDYRVFLKSWLFLYLFGNVLLVVVFLTGSIYKWCQIVVPASGRPAVSTSGNGENRSDYYDCIFNGKKARGYLAGSQ